MDERDAMAGPAVGIVRNPFRYGEDDNPAPIIERKGRFIEFACDPQSGLSQVVAARGVEIIRVDKTTYDILDTESMRELDAIVDLGDCDMWGALPCLPWSTWQYVNMAKHGEKYRDKLGGERDIETNGRRVHPQGRENHRRRRESSIRMAALLHWMDINADVGIRHCERHVGG